ncbi:MAG: T9SS type A sorting domain-containing protein [Cyclobacteriaceae bacterium]|nr:MAG: T9SS type A sorting domain-containing protein [Cyclobacteriaceae bacterium]
MQKLQLSIPEPCHENWQEMTPTQQGRFCKACAKEVIDFSMMTDTEVLNYFINLREEKVCGRALPSQLNRAITYPKEPKKRLFWYWNYLLMCFLFFSKNSSVKAQGGVKPVVACTPVSEADKNGQYPAGSRVITGKVVDVDGNPVSFASVRIKGTNAAVTADAKGAYSIRVMLDAALRIGAVGYKDSEVTTGAASVINTVLEKSVSGFMEAIVVTVGGIRRANPEDAEFTPASRNKAILRIIDEKAGTPVAGATIFLSKRYQSKSDTGTANKKGIFKIKNIGKYEHCYLKVEAPGYEVYEFEIDGSEFLDKNKEFLDRSKEWEVALKKKETVIRLGQIAQPDFSKKMLTVIDGKIDSAGTVINPDDVDEYRILNAAEASALFGQAGMNGALLISTRKAREVELSGVEVTAELGYRKMAGMMGSVRIVQKQRLLAETKAGLATLLGDSLKIYPNPVQRGQSFQVALKLKDAGYYHVQVTDASGKIVWQQVAGITARDQQVQVAADPRWAAGLYYIRIYNNKTSLIRKSSFIVQ